MRTVSELDVIVRCSPVPVDVTRDSRDASSSTCPKAEWDGQFLVLARFEQHACRDRICMSSADGVIVTREHRYLLSCRVAVVVLDL